jgi:hypothetical protein
LSIVARGRSRFNLTFDEDAPHQLRGDLEELRAVLSLRAIRSISLT